MPACPKCGRSVLVGAPVCRWCKAALEVPDFGGTGEEPLPEAPQDPWRPPPFPYELIPVVLIFAFLIYFSPFYFSCFDVVALICIVRRSIGGWWLAVVMSGFHIAFGIVGLAAREWSPSQQAFIWTLIAAPAAALLLLIVCHLRGAYVHRLAGELPHRLRETARMACKSCGVTFEVQENHAHRAGFCSSRCLRASG